MTSFKTRVRCALLGMLLAPMLAIASGIIITDGGPSGEFYDPTRSGEGFFIEVAKVGDAIVLTKPLGSGYLCTAIKRGVLPEADTQRVMEIMAALNKGAGEAMLEVGPGRILVGFTTESGRVPRQGYDLVSLDHTPVGKVVSGSPSPTMNRKRMWPGAAGPYNANPVESGPRC